MSEDREWHLSKSVPVTFILAIMLQTAALIWFVATLRNDVDTNALQIERISISHETRIDALEKVVQDQSILLARIDENLKGIRATLEQIKNGRQ